jgi:ATP-dependent helicase/nuclease subunit A
MIEEFVDSGKLEKAAADSIDARDVVKFTKTDLFRRMKAAENANELFREQKFLMSVPVNEIYPDSDSKETMILQGIIDVCFLENGKYVIADYKTDRVNTLEELTDRYCIQLECYKKAVEQISGKEVSDMIIYSVRLGDEIKVKAGKLTNNR